MTLNQPVIALVFDFDDTLAPDSTSKVLEAVGIDPAEFWARHRQRLTEGWDQVPAFMQMMLEESRARDGAITREVIRNVGRNLRFFPGVLSMFKRYRELIEDGDGFEAHFYVISSGLGDLIASTRIAHFLRDFWGSNFAYNASGEIDAIKNVISFTDKTRYLFQISKGQIGPQTRTNPFIVNEKVTDYRVRLENAIYVGDGYTDIPCFHLVQDRFGGVALGVFDATDRKKVGKAFGLVKAERVRQINSANYSKGSGADDYIQAAITHIKDRILQERA